MKDILISSIRIKKELVTLIVCFIIGFAANIGAIVFYKSSYVELVTSLPYVLVFVLIIYVIWSLLRIIIGLLFKTKNSKSL